MITGFGVCSSLGCVESDIVKSLKEGISGISFSNEMKEYGLRSHVWGNISKNRFNEIPYRLLRFMNFSSMYSYIAMKDSISNSGLCKNIYMKNPRVGVIIGSGSSFIPIDSSFIKKKKYFYPVTPYSLIKSMPSSISACLGAFFEIYGINYSISSACATSAHCIGNAYELILSGKQDIIFAGGGEELSLNLAHQFDVMRVLSVNFNQQPNFSSRPFDNNRDGFVISGGSGVLVLEELHCALSRKANIYGEIIGYGSTCDGESVVHPSGDGFVRCMSEAIKNINGSVDYINAHGTSTKIGDIKELIAIKTVFQKYGIPYISSTKSISGHSLGASGAQEMIYIMLMLKYNFIAPSMNIESLDPIAKNMNIVRNSTNYNIKIAMSNSFGFGGTNVSLVIKRYP